MKRCNLETVHRGTIREGYVCITKLLFWILFNVTHPPTSEISGPLFSKRIHHVVHMATVTLEKHCSKIGSLRGVSSTRRPG